MIDSTEVSIIANWLVGLFVGDCFHDSLPTYILHRLYAVDETPWHLFNKPSFKSHSPMSARDQKVPTGANKRQTRQTRVTWGIMRRGMEAWDALGTVLLRVLPLCSSYTYKKPRYTTANTCRTASLFVA